MLCYLQPWPPAGMLTKVMRTVIKPMITYSFGVAPYTPAQLKVFDAQLARAAKAAYKQRVSMSTTLAMEDVGKVWSGTHLPAIGIHTPASGTW
jgi:hypothetical protein